MTEQSSKKSSNGELEIGLVGLALLAVIFGVLGIFLNEESMLPYFFGTSGLFFLISGIGAYKQVPLIKKWTPFPVFKLLAHRRKGSEEEDQKKAFSIMTIVNFVLAFVMFFLTLRLYW